MDVTDDPTRPLAGSPEILVERADADYEAIPPPKGFLAIAFTDIQDSTILWDEMPHPMQEAVRIHDDILHANSNEFGGYEVKSVGDAFMVAFHTAKSALQFCLRVQTDLIAADWPAQILDSNYGKQERDDEYNLIYRGLSVRMAIHWGEPVCQSNRMTGRMDYIGSMVHRVSGLIDAADGGQIVVTEDFISALEGAARNARERPAVHPKGLGMGLNGEEMEDGLPLQRSRASSAGSSAAGPSAAGPSAAGPSNAGPSTAFRRPRQQAFAVKNAGEYQPKGLASPSYLYKMTPASLSGRLKRSRQVEEPAVQGWFEWAREGLASNAAEQNILPV